ncbi:MAG: flavodoxin family protein, partial [Odoribacter sp.]|nr:flavodoxin family protein [Odoribacter sp.]
YMLTSAAEDEAHVPTRAVSGLEGWIACFERARLAGSVFAGGVTEPGEIEGHPALQRAYELGKSVG